MVLRGTILERKKIEQKEQNMSKKEFFYCNSSLKNSHA